MKATIGAALCRLAWVWALAVLALAVTKVTVSVLTHKGAPLATIGPVLLKTWDLWVVAYLVSVIPLAVVTYIELRRTRKNGG